MQKQFSVYLIGKKSLFSDLLATGLERQNFAKLEIVEKIQAFYENISSAAEIIVLIDCSVLSLDILINEIQGLQNLFGKETKIACINVKESDEWEQNLIHVGVRGVFYKKDSLDSVRKGLAAIKNNELWFSRKKIEKALLLQIENKTRINKRNGGLEEHLTSREVEVLLLISAGVSYKKIAEHLFISFLTVKTHTRNIYRKINASNRVEAILWANSNLLPQRSLSEEMRMLQN